MILSDSNLFKQFQGWLTASVIKLTVGFGNMTASNSVDYPIDRES